MDERLVLFTEGAEGFKTQTDHRTVMKFKGDITVVRVAAHDHLWSEVTRSPYRPPVNVVLCQVKPGTA